MSKTLIVPDYIAKKRAEDKAQNPKKEGELEKAYVKSENLVLDPAKLSEKAIDRLPQPTGWRILLLPFQGKKQTKEVFSLLKKQSSAKLWELFVGTFCSRSFSLPR